MKAIAVCASPHKRNTYALLEQVLRGCSDAGVECETWSAAGKTNLRQCMDCDACAKLDRCVLGDEITPLLEQLRSADIIVLGTPVYFYDVSAQMKTIIDRTHSLRTTKRNQVGGIVVTAGSTGISSAVKTLEMFFSSQGITMGGWVASYEPVDASKPKCMASAYTLGQKLVRMARFQTLEDTDAYAAHNHFSYGTHSF